MPKLYDSEISGSCYKIRLLSSILGVTLDKAPVDFVNKEQKTAPYVALNPFESFRSSRTATSVCGTPRRS